MGTGRRQDQGVVWTIWRCRCDCTLCLAWVVVLDALLTSLPGLQAVAIDDTAPNKSWALVTFKSESAVEKATQQPVQVGTETLKVESASFSKAVEMNRITVAHGRNWKTEVAGALP